MQQSLKFHFISLAPKFYLFYQRKKSLFYLFLSYLEGIRIKLKMAIWRAPLISTNVNCL